MESLRAINQISCSCHNIHWLVHPFPHFLSLSSPRWGVLLYPHLPFFSWACTLSLLHVSSPSLANPLPPTSQPLLQIVPPLGVPVTATFRPCSVTQTVCQLLLPQWNSFTPYTHCHPRACIISQLYICCSNVLCWERSESIVNIGHFWVSSLMSHAKSPVVFASGWQPPASFFLKLRRQERFWVAFPAVRYCLVQFDALLDCWCLLWTPDPVL